MPRAWYGWGRIICGLVVLSVVYCMLPRLERSATRLFMYAVEVGVTLTVMLLLADMSLPFESNVIAIGFMILGLISIHAERAFPPGEGEFRRERFGLPLFWSGHVQIGISLIAVVQMQVSDFLAGVDTHRLLAAGVWLTGAYAYLYSDLIVRRVGVYVYLAALALLASVLTLVAGYFNMEAAILVLTITALAANIVERKMVVEQRFSRIVAPLGIVLGGVPLFLGWLLHVRATSDICEELDWSQSTSFFFVGVMLAVAVCTRISAWMYRSSARRRTVVHLFYSAAALIIAAAGLLRVMDIDQWSEQAPLLMVIPIAYLVAARLWRGHLEERALGWVAHTAAAVILFHGLISIVDLKAMLTPMQGDLQNLWLGIVFVEATVFYALTAIFRRSSPGGYLSAACACAALWQFLGYLQVDPLPAHLAVRHPGSWRARIGSSTQDPASGDLPAERPQGDGHARPGFGRLSSGQRDSERCISRSSVAGCESIGIVWRRLAPTVSLVPDGGGQLCCHRFGAGWCLASRVCHIHVCPGRSCVSDTQPVD